MPSFEVAVGTHRGPFIEKAFLRIIIDLDSCTEVVAEARLEVDSTYFTNFKEPITKPVVTTTSSLVAIGVKCSIKCWQLVDFNPVTAFWL